MNILWPMMIIVAIVTGMVTGRIDETLAAGFKAAENTVMTVFSFAGMMCFWSGMLEVAEAGGICAKLEKLLHPLISVLFPKLKKGSSATKKITSNIAANLLGMGNAATPAGIEAMSELDKINGGREYPSDEMCIFTVLNTASIQLIPTTVISMRAAVGAIAPAKILLPVWICSVCSLFSAVGAMKLILKSGKGKKL